MKLGLFNSIKSKLLTFFVGSIVMFGILYFSSEYLLTQTKTNAVNYQNIVKTNQAFLQAINAPIADLYHTTLVVASTEVTSTQSSSLSTSQINQIINQARAIKKPATESALLAVHLDGHLIRDLTQLTADQEKFLEILNTKIIPHISNNQVAAQADIAALTSAYKKHQSTSQTIALKLQHQALNEEHKLIELEQQAKQFLSLFAVFTALAGLFIALMITRNIAKPIDHIIHHVGEISNGNYNVSVLASGVKELLNLSNKINKMANKLQEQNQYREESQQEISKYQANLVQALEEQRAIFDSAGLGIALMQNRKILRLNPTFAQLFKASEEELLDKSIEQYYVNPNDFEKIGKDGYGKIRNGETYTDVIEFKNAAGKNFICRVSGKALNTANIERGTVWIFEDITDRRKLLNELREHAAFLDTLVDSIPIPVFYKDAEAKFLVVNKAYEEVFDVKREYLIGKTVKEVDFYNAEERKKYYEEDINVIKYQLNNPLKRDITFADGNVHNTIYWLKGFTKPDGTIGGQVGTIIDNTEQQKAQIATEKAKQMAEDSARMKTDFLANMSHEIRTPMNAIIGMSHLMLKTPLEPKQVDYLSKMQQSGQHLMGLINDILDFSKLEAGQVKIESYQINLDRLIENVSDLVQFKANEKGLTLNFDLGPNVPSEVMGDGLRISQILINYVNNAVKFTENGEITIITRLENETEDKVDIYFGVKDTGVGISESAKKRLFESFQQADTSTTRKYGGTGLGLAICKKLAELMGGSVGVESIPGIGSTFWYRVGLYKAALSDAKKNLTTQISGERVLIVDDNAYSRQVLSDLLSDISLRVDLASSGAEAVIMTRDAANAETPYKIIFLDWHMPDMDGFETANQIRSLGLPSEAKIVLVTAFGREDVINNTAAYGIENIIIKPVTVSVLHDTVASIFGVESTRNAVESQHESNQFIGKIAGSHVLVVEDNELNQEVAAGLLAHAKIHTDIANHGLEAIAKIEQNQYDLVLMDMQMPMMGGIEATLKIREDKKFAKLPIIAMTANVLKDDREKCIAAGMNDFLPKPIEPDQLWAMLVKWIPSKHQQAESNIPNVDVMPANSNLHEKLSSKLPESIDGLDMRAGLKRVLGNETLYISMLTKFLSGQKNAVADINQHLNNNDWATAERIAHTIKGLSASIGAQHIADKASVLEIAIKQKNTPEIAIYLENLHAPLEKLLKSLNESLGQKEDNIAVVELSNEALFNKLCSMLRNDDPEAVDFFNAYKSQCRNVLGDAYVEVKNNIEGFSFDIAYERIEAALNSSDH